MHVLTKFACTSPPSAGLSSRFLLRSMHKPRPYTVTHVWAPAELRGTCSGRSKSSELALFRWIAFHPARAEHVHGNPKLSCFSFFHLRCCF